MRCQHSLKFYFILFSMEGDYLELSQFLYNFLQFPYNSYPSSLGTIGFLTSGIRAVDLETSDCDRRKLWKEVRKMLNKVSEDVKDISKKVKSLAESKKAMKEELSRWQEDLENMTKEELQSLGSIDQESRIPDPVAVGMEQEHTVGVNTSDLMLDVGQTHALTNGAAHVIKNVGVELTVMHVGGNSIEFGFCYGGHVLLIDDC